MASVSGETGFPGSPRIPRDSLQSNSSSSSSTSAPRSVSGANLVRSPSSATQPAGAARSSSSSSSHRAGQVGTPTPQPNPKNVFVQNYRRRRGQTTVETHASTTRLSNTVGSLSSNPVNKTSMEDSARSFASVPRSTASQSAPRPVPLPPSVMYPAGPSPQPQSIAMSPFGFPQQPQARDSYLSNNASVVRSPHMVVTPTACASLTTFPSPASIQTPREPGDATTHRTTQATAASEALLRDHPAATTIAGASSQPPALDPAAIPSAATTPLANFSILAHMRCRHPQWFLVYLSSVVCSLFVALVVVQQAENVSRTADHVFHLHASDASGSLMALRLLVEEEKSWIAHALPLLTADNETVATRLPMWVNTTVSERKESLRRVKDKALEMESLLARLVQEFVESVHRCGTVGPLHCAALEALTLRELGAAAERRQRNTPRPSPADPLSSHSTTVRDDSASTTSQERPLRASVSHSTFNPPSSSVDGTGPMQKHPPQQHSLLVRVGAFLVVVGLVSLAARMHGKS